MTGVYEFGDLEKSKETVSSPLPHSKSSHFAVFLMIYQGKWVPHLRSLSQDYQLSPNLAAYVSDYFYGLLDVGTVEWAQRT